MASRSRRVMSGGCQQTHPHPQQQRSHHSRAPHGQSGKGRRGPTGKYYEDMQQRQTAAGVPPGLQPTMTTAAGGKRTFEHKPANGQVMVVMRYKSAMDRSIRNCIVRMLGRIGRPGTEGRCLGVTDKVEVLESPEGSDWLRRRDWCLALFLFPSEGMAQRWYDSERELKQHDFLPPSDGVELFVVKLRYLPKLEKGGKLTFNWMEMHNVRSRSFLQNEFVNKVAPLLDDQQVNHGLVFLQDPSELYRLKESWISHNADAYCVVNVFQDEEQFHRIFRETHYANLRQRRDEICDTVSLLFTIDSNITGCAPAR